MPVEVWALLSPIVAGVILAVVDRWLKRSESGIAQRKDLRDEIKDLWQRCDEQDARLDAQGKVIAEQQRQLAERDRRIAELEQHLVELDDYKKKYATVGMENSELRWQLKEHEALKAEVYRLRQEVERLKRIESSGVSE